MWQERIHKRLKGIIVKSGGKVRGNEISRKKEIQAERENEQKIKSHWLWIDYVELKTLEGPQELVLLVSGGQLT